MLSPFFCPLEFGIYRRGHGLAFSFVMIGGRPDGLENGMYLLLY
jgi:hypothetical protein